MRFVVYGAGGIGGVIGARLFEHGHDVVLIARGAHLEAIEARRVADRLGRGLADAAAFPPPAIRLQLELQADDVVVLAMKSQDTAGALDALASCAPPDIAVVCAQNGVANERAALRLFRQRLRDVRDVPDRPSRTRRGRGVLVAGHRPARHRSLSRRARRDSARDRGRARRRRRSGPNLAKTSCGGSTRSS